MTVDIRAHCFLAALCFAAGHPREAYQQLRELEKLVALELEFFSAAEPSGGYARPACWSPSGKSGQRPCAQSVSTSSCTPA